MSRPQIIPHYTFSNAIFLYKTTNDGEWTTPPCSEHHSKYNCCDIRFDDFGVCVTQRNTEHEIVCHLKLVLQSPIITTENNQFTVEAACVGIRSLDLVPYRNGKSAHALEHLETLPLALIRDTIIAVTLIDLTGTPEGTEMLAQQELIQLIPSLIEQGFQGWSARGTNGSSESTSQPEIRNGTVFNIEQTITPGTRHTNGSSESATQPEIRNETVSNTEQTMTPKTAIPRYRHPQRRYSSNAQSYESSRPSVGSHGTEQVARHPTLEERLEAHHFGVTTVESWLMQRLEDGRLAMLNDTGPITEAINHHFDRMVEVTLQEHWARATIIRRHIVAEYNRIRFRE